MKQFQFTFKDENTLDLELRKIRKWSMSNLCSALLIQVYTELLDRDMIEHTSLKIREQLPDALVVGCSWEHRSCRDHFSSVVQRLSPVHCIVDKPAHDLADRSQPSACRVCGGSPERKPGKIPVPVSNEP